MSIPQDDGIRLSTVSCPCCQEGHGSEKNTSRMGHVETFGVCSVIAAWSLDTSDRSASLEWITPVCTDMGRPANYRLGRPRTRRKRTTL